MVKALFGSLKTQKAAVKQKHSCKTEKAVVNLKKAAQERFKDSKKQTCAQQESSNAS